MLDLEDFILLEDVRRFSNWVRPSEKDLEHEYKIEYSIKPLKGMTNDAFPTVDHFLEAARRGKVISVSKSLDSRIGYRSHTTDKEDLLSLIRGYRSYPKFRNEQTIEAIYRGFEKNSPMTMPVVLMMPNKRLRIMGGNTRMDIAQHLGIKPKVLLIKVPKKGR